LRALFRYELIRLRPHSRSHDKTARSHARSHSLVHARTHRSRSHDKTARSLVHARTHRARSLCALSQTLTRAQTLPASQPAARPSAVANFPDADSRAAQRSPPVTHARGLPLLGMIQVAILPKQGVLAAPVPRLQRASKHLQAPSSLGASAETSCRRRRRDWRPTPAGSRYWGRFTLPFCRARCAICARAAPSARLEAFWATCLT
jgi:hypothetical protein